MRGTTTGNSPYAAVVATEIAVLIWINMGKAGFLLHLGHFFLDYGVETSFSNTEINQIHTKNSACFRKPEELD